MFATIGLHSYRVIAQIDTLKDSKLASTRKRLVFVVVFLTSKLSYSSVPSCLNASISLDCNDRVRLIVGCSSGCITTILLASWPFLRAQSAYLSPLVVVFGDFINIVGSQIFAAETRASESSLLFLFHDHLFSLFDLCCDIDRVAAAAAAAVAGPNPTTRGALVGVTSHGNGPTTTAAAGAAIGMKSPVSPSFTTTMRPHWHHLPSPLPSLPPPTIIVASSSSAPIRSLTHVESKHATASISTVNNTTIVSGTTVAQAGAFGSSRATSPIPPHTLPATSLPPRATSSFMGTTTPIINTNQGDVAPIIMDDNHNIAIGISSIRGLPAPLIS
jgi:hypothetical protein